MLVHSVRRVPAPTASSCHRISKPPQLYSSALGASARFTLVSVTRGTGAPTVVSFTEAPTASRFPSASNGAHSRRCVGSVIACQTVSGAWRSSRTRTSVHFSSPFCPRSFCIRAMLAEPGVYCSRSIIFVSLASSLSASLPACQLRELNDVATGVFQHGNGRTGHVGRRHCELRPARLDPLVIALDVIGDEVGRRLALLKDRLLIRFDHGVVVQRQLQFSAVRFFGRAYGQPPIRAITEIGFLSETQYLRIKAQGLALVVDVYAGQFDFHSVSPLSGSRFWPRRLFLGLLFRRRG